MMNELGFSLNLLTDLVQYQFLRNAFEAGTVVAIIAGVVGYFVVLRRSAFVAHAFSEIGFAGAAGAVLVGWPAMLGMLLGSSLGGTAIAVLSRRSTHRDTYIGIVLAFALGLGLLFISLYTGYATEAYSILFGEILGIAWDSVLLTFGFGVIVLVGIGIMYRPLLFSSLDEDVAEAKGMPTLLIGVVFLLMVAIAVSMAIQVVGVLLIFSLMVTPAATAQHLGTKSRSAIIVSVIISLAATWGGLYLSLFIPYPPSFFVTTIVFGAYVATRALHKKVGAERSRLRSWGEWLSAFVRRDYPSP